MKFRRFLFKLSGETLMGNKSWGYDVEAMTEVADEIAAIHQLGKEVCVVVGGGNLFRGSVGVANLIERTDADYMGMMATVMNGVALQNFLVRANVPVVIQSALGGFEKICETYNKRKALDYLHQGKVIIFVAGTGNPFFTTDTASVLRASEMNCDVVFKGTQVDGVYDKDPKEFPQACHYKTITFDEVIRLDVRIMDQTAFALAKSNNMPIIVFNFFGKDALLHTIESKNPYTLISNNVPIKVSD
jgi:uridylate kinase